VHGFDLSGPTSLEGIVNL